MQYKHASKHTNTLRHKYIRSCWVSVRVLPQRKCSITSLAHWNKLMFSRKLRIRTHSLYPRYRDRQSVSCLTSLSYFVLLLLLLLFEYCAAFFSLHTSCWFVLSGLAVGSYACVYGFSSFHQQIASTLFNRKYTFWFSKCVLLLSFPIYVHNAFYYAHL